MSGTFKKVPEHVFLVIDSEHQCWAKADTELEAKTKLENIDPRAKPTHVYFMHESAWVDGLGTLLVAEDHMIESCRKCKILLEP